MIILNEVPFIEHEKIDISEKSHSYSTQCRLYIVIVQAQVLEDVIHFCLNLILRILYS